MFVWRVENEQGQGPFVSNDMDPTGVYPRGSIEWDAYYKANTLPTPAEDGISEGYDSGFGLGHAGMRSGGASKEALGQWFPELVRRDLAAKGYQYAEYDVPDADAFHGRHQVSFYKRNAKLVQRIPMEKA